MDSGQEKPDSGKAWRLMGMDLEVLKLECKGTCLLICGGWHLGDLSVAWCGSRVRPFVGHCVRFFCVFPMTILCLCLARFLSPFTSWMTEPLFTPLRSLPTLQQTTNPISNSAIQGESHVTLDNPIHPTMTSSLPYLGHPPHDNPPPSVPGADTANTPGNTSPTSSTESTPKNTPGTRTRPTANTSRIEQEGSPPGGPRNQGPTPQNPTTQTTTTTTPYDSQTKHNPAPHLQPGPSAPGSSNPPVKYSQPRCVRSTATSKSRVQSTSSISKAKHGVAKAASGKAPHEMAFS